LERPKASGGTGSDAWLEEHPGSVRPLNKPIAGQPHNEVALYRGANQRETVRANDTGIQDRIAEDLTSARSDGDQEFDR
jgi:hypothetical protein